MCCSGDGMCSRLGFQVVLLGGRRTFKQEGLVGRHRWTGGSEWEGVSSKGTVGLSTPTHFLLLIDHRVSGLICCTLLPWYVLSPVHTKKCILWHSSLVLFCFLFFFICCQKAQDTWTCSKADHLLGIWRNLFCNDGVNSSSLRSLMF